MAAEIILITPAPKLGDDIRRILPGGRFNLRVTGDFADALKLVRKTGASLALLDTDIDQTGASLLDIGYSLHQLNQDIELIIIARGEKLPDLGTLQPRVILRIPLVPAELMAIVNDIYPPVLKQGGNALAAALSTDDDFPWLRDVTRAAQHLTRLTLESSAQAALITRDTSLWAYAGQLSQNAANELSQTVLHYWDWQSDSDLLRFVRLAATDQAHMLYATRLSPSMILAMVFDGETPFSTIRSQAGRLARSLAATPPEEAKQPKDTLVLLKSSSHDDLEDHRYPHIAELLNDVPPPNPIRAETNAPQPAATQKAESKPAAEPPKPSSPVPPPPARIITPAPNFSVESAPARLAGQPEVSIDEVDPMAETRPSSTGPTLADMAATHKQSADDSESLIETMPQQSLGDTSQRIIVESTSASLYYLNYACLLIPRFDDHHLTGDLADRIGEWIPQICIAFGWRLEYLAIRPEYLQWIVNVPPQTSPGTLMRVMRQQLSDRIFEEFMRLKKQNPSGDFWAPGYLIMGGGQLHPPKLVKDFIRQTRQRQGISGKTSH